MPSNPPPHYLFNLIVIVESKRADYGEQSL